ncbi:MAG: DedA family protein [Nitrospirales bacterium]
MDWGFEWIGRYGYWAIFILLLLGIVGLPVPDETLLLLVGYLSFTGDLRLEPALVAAFLGSACGVSVSYALGRVVGIHAVDRLANRLHISPAHMALTHRWVARWGKYVLLVAYFIPGVRHLAALVMGATLLPPLVSARFAYTGALVWSSTFIGLGYVGGEEWRHLSPGLHRTVVISAVIVVLAIAILVVVFWRHRKTPPP